VDYIELNKFQIVTEYDNGCSLLVDYERHTVTVYRESSEPVVYQF
jgi:hypothetical protein